MKTLERIQYHQYENGLLIKEYSENGTVYYEIVSKVEYKEEVVQVKPPKENKLLDGFQFVLDVAGLVPVYGEIADGLNGVIYYARGDKLNAGLSFAAMVPFLGWGSTGTKIVNKGRNFFQPKNVLNDEVVESVSTSVYRDMANSPRIGSQSRLNLFTSLQNGTPNANNSPFMFNMPSAKTDIPATSKTPSGGVHPEIQNPNVANKTPDLDGTGANSSKVQASAVQPPSKGNIPEAKSAVASSTKGNPNEQIQDLPKVVGGNGDPINLSNTTIPNKSTKTVTTPTAKASNPAPVSNGKANVKSETPNSNIQAKPKVVGGNADYTAPPKNAKTINAPSAKVDTTPTNKSVDGKVNTDVKSVDVETKGTGNTKHLDDVPRIKEIEVNFNRNVKHDSEEFARQLKDQEKGMNELTVDEYQKNRERYIAEGRAIEGNVAQQTAREEAFSDKVAELMSNGKSFDEAEKEAKEWLNTQAALHNPDQIAGGKPDQVDGMGHKGINSSIGSQWRYRIDVVDEQIREMAKNMTPEQLKNTFLNVKLTH